MKLKSVQIKNYRSIKDITLEMIPVNDKSHTYGLIGINEAGKSSILKSLAFLDEHTGIKPLANEVHDKTKPIELFYTYEQSDEEIKECQDVILEKVPDQKIDDKQLKNVILNISFSLPDLAKVKSITLPNVVEDLRKTLETLLLDQIYRSSHYTIYWKSEDKYLIGSQISLSAFSSNPENISIPLKNCFALIGLDTKEKIQAKILEITTDSTEREALRDSLAKKITSLIKKIWPNHPITITFDISGDEISLHVKDPNGRSRTTSQRSDGFKQFLSFLLNISSQNENHELSDSIILLDEPETHLHPQAQEYFLSELIKLTQSDNNICFFATHSNFLIDKKDLSRNYRVLKTERTGETQLKKLDEKIMTYSSVNYEVFDIPSTDYHNELYSELHERYQDADTADNERSRILNFDNNHLHAVKLLPLDKPWKKSPNKITLPTYIRNCIHHPDNGDTYKGDDLRKSIDLLRSYL